MSTRGCIARMTGKVPVQFRGVYHHWDSYPSGLGRTLFQLYKTHFKGDIETMLATLIDKHPAGWSTLVDRRFDLEPGWSDLERSEQDDGRPLCYCHGGRHETGWKVTEHNASGSGVEYVYAFSGSTMFILASFCDDGSKMIGMFGSGDPNAAWRIVAEVNLAGARPNWDLLDESPLVMP